jgi:type VI protein secretion system component Hcp
MRLDFLNHWVNRFFPVQSRRQRRGLRKPQEPRVRPGIEILEDRTVPAFALGVTFDAGSGPLPELPLEGYSWGVGSGHSVQEFSLSLPGPDVEPGLWGFLAANALLDTATIHVRNPAGFEYITYTLDNVLITSFTTSQDRGGVPQDSISLNFTKVTESFRELKPDGSPGATNTVVYDLIQGKADDVGNLALGASTAVRPQLGLTLVENGTALPEKDISSYSWGVSGGLTSADFSDITIGLEGNAAEPSFWGLIVGDGDLDSAIIHVRNAAGQEYLTYTLADPTITSFTTGNAAGDRPLDSLALEFKRLSETAFPIQPDGRLGDPNTATYDTETAKVLENGSLAVGESTAVAPRLGLTLVEAGVTLAEKDLLSYKWEVGTADDASPPSFSSLDLSFVRTAAEPAFWARVAAGTSLDEAIIHVRNALGIEYATYTLTDVRISSFSASQPSGGIPQDSISLNFTTFAESFRPIKPDGSAGAANTAKYDLAQAEFVDGTIDLAAGASESEAPRLGLTFIKGDVAYPEKDVSSYFWDASVDGMRAGFSDFTLVLPETALEPTLWGYLARHQPLHDDFDFVILHVRDSLGRERLAYTLSGVSISSFNTTVEGGGVPHDTIAFRFDRVKESYRTIDSKGTPGPTNTAEYDLKEAKILDAGSLDFGASTALKPRLGLTLVDGGVTIAEKDLEGFSWGVATTIVRTGSERDTSLPAFSDISLVLHSTAAEPAFWARLAAGTSLDEAIIHVRNAQGIEYATYTLTDVRVGAFSTSAASGDAPVDTVTLQFATLAESFSPIQPNGTAGPANTAKYDLTTLMLEGTKRLDVGASVAEAPRLGLTLIDDGNELPEKDLLSYSWGVAIIDQKVSPDEFEILVPANAAEPGFWASVAGSRVFDRAIIHVRDSQGREYATYMLDNPLFSSFSTSLSLGGVPVDDLTINYEKITETFRSIRPDGKLGPANTAGFDLESGVSEALGSLGSFATTTTLSTPASTAIYGEPVTFTATVSAEGAIPVGTVTFFDGMTAISGAIDLAAAGGLQQASFTINSLGVGPHSITAVFTGNSAFVGSNSAAAALAVTPAATTTTVASAKPSSVYGDTVTFTATVSASAPSTLPPTGSVRFLVDGVTVSGPIALATVGGVQQASFTINSLGAGTHVITAAYEDPTGSDAGSSGTATQTVARAKLIVAAADQTRIQGEANPAFTATYSGFVLGQDPGVLGGTLTFTTAATASSPPGTYAIVPGGLTSANYDIQFVSGTLTVLSFAEATGNLSEQVNAAEFSHGRGNALDSSLRAAIASFQRGNTTAAVNQLQAFENKVRAQRGKSIDPALADELLAAAERIIEAVHLWPVQRHGRR